MMFSYLLKNYLDKILIFSDVQLTHFMPLASFYPPENIRKPEVLR